MILKIFINYFSMLYLLIWALIYGIQVANENNQ